MRIALFFAGALAAAAFAAPFAARADIYKWIDEKGVVNYTNIKRPAGVKNVERFEEERISTVPAAVSSEQIAGRREVELHARVERLERELEAQQAPTPIGGGYDPYYAGYASSPFPMFDYPLYGYPAFGPSGVFVGGGHFRRFPNRPVIVKPVPGSTIGGSLIVGRPVFGGQVFGSPVFGSPIVGSPFFGSPTVARSGHARAMRR
jgi:Domain of unknown function (DUF4124)